MPKTKATALSMKLYIDRKAQRLLFAEASKDVVDFLFAILALPVATAVELVGKEAMVGCVGNLYASVEKLDSTYLQAGVANVDLLCPTVVSPYAIANTRRSLLCLPKAKNLFRCGKTVAGSTYCGNYITDMYNKKCPGNCGNHMTAAVQYLSSAVPSNDSGKVAAAAPQSAAEGIVQGVVTYMVLDDLTVTPMAGVSSVATVLNTFAVRDIGDLQEKTVQLGYKEGLAILKASLKSKSVLTNVFVHANNSSVA
ncbi:DUF674 family protein [Zea mays]|uniref:DUF674 family protein n=1 Tax=Zea mays TaxID=4577 RepID=A0A1D6ML75_MAIZE|nr:DUF674 family protein [Zea mays]|eukprot:XP_008673697.1 uncharacterized protein LOC103649749 [Zea mays]